MERKGQLVAIVLLCPLLSMAQYSPYSSQMLVNSQGAKIGAFATVRVCSITATGNPCLPLAAIYSSQSGALQANPFTADQNGNFSFWAAPGTYTINLSFGSATYSYPISINATSLLIQCGLGTASDAGAAIQACINSLPASGGVVDATTITGTQSSASSISLNKPVTLRLCAINLTFNGWPGMAVTSNGVHISGCGPSANLIQGSVGSSGTPHNLISNSSAVTGLEVDHLLFTGVSGTTFVGGNDGVNLLQCTRCLVHDNSFTGLQHDAVWAQNSTDINVHDNNIYSISDGLRFTGVVGGIIHHNKIENRQVTDTTFTIAIIQDSVAGTIFQNSTDTNITDNTIIGYHNSQAIIVHDGVRGVIENNVLSDVGAGIAISAFASPDATSDWAVVGNTINLTSVSASQTVNYGISCNGNNTTNLVCHHVSIAGNTINNANAVLKSDTQGAILDTNSDDVNITGNVIHSPYGWGIDLQQSALRHNIRSNTIMDVQASSGTYQNGIGTPCVGCNPLLNTVTGEVDDNFVDNAVSMIRSDVYNPGLFIGNNNRGTNLSGTPIVNPTNMNVDQQITPEQLGIGKAPLYPLDIAKIWVSGVVAAPPAPTCTGSTTGGSLAAGNYVCAMTFSNQFGETVRSSETTATVASGSTGEIVVTHPTQPGGATTWNVYLSAVGGVSGSETRQNTGGIPFSGNDFAVTSITAGSAPPITNGTGGPFFGDRDVVTLSPSVTDATTSYATEKVITTNNGNSQNLTGTMAAVNGEADHQGTGSVSTIDSYNAAASNLSSGTVTLGRSYASTLRNSGTGTFTQGVDFHALAPVANSATAITLGTTHGTGYATGDTYSIDTCGAVGSVSAQSGGVVSAVQLVSGGTSCVTGTNVSTTSITGSGTGLTVNIGSVSTPLTTRYAFKADDPGINCTTCWQFYGVGTQPSFFGGVVMLGLHTVSSGTGNPALPSAASNAGAWASVSDSTAITAEGQNCVGGGTVTAAAFSNGSTWKCF